MLSIAGKEIQTIVDSEIDPSIEVPEQTPKYYDIVGFDPRGVNNTTPSISCFPDPSARQLWDIQQHENGLPGSSDKAFEKRWAREKALGEGCSQRFAVNEDGGDGLGFYMNTAPNVADMIEIVERHGQWREKYAMNWPSSFKGVLATLGKASADIYSAKAILERTRWRAAEERLLFYGYSYGTVLGSTLAAMQPHLIERMVLDGVVDAADYYHGV